MMTKYTSLVMALAALGVAVPSVVLDARQPNDRATWCGWEPQNLRGLSQDDLRLKPRDEGPQRPDFVAFRRQLQDAIARKDTEAVMKIVDPAVRVDFGGGQGLEHFRQRIDDPEANFWEEFARVMTLGGSFYRPVGDLSMFYAPYIYSVWPDNFDSYECLAVIGTGVRVREAPRVSARTLATLDYAIVAQLSDYEPDIPNWTHVRLANGTTGYIASNLVRSPIDYRAGFQFKDGRWWIVAFIAGD